MNDNEQLPIIVAMDSKRLILRPITLDDAHGLFNYAKDEIVTKFVPWQPHKTIADSIKFIEFLRLEYERRSALMWAVQLKSDKTNTIIGTCGFVRYYGYSKCLEVGYAKEALHAVIKYGFEVTDAIRIEGTCVVDNIGSAKTMSSVGMQFEGILRSNFIKDGKVSDCKIFSIVRSDI